MKIELTTPQERLTHDARRWGARYFLLIASIGMLLFILFAIGIVLLRFHAPGNPPLRSYFLLRYKTFPNYVQESDAWKPLTGCLSAALGFLCLETWIGRNIYHQLHGSLRRRIGVWLLSSILVATVCSFLMVFISLWLNFEVDEFSFELSARDFYPLFAFGLLPWFLAAISLGAVSYLLLHLRIRPLEKEAFMETTALQHQD